MKSFFTKPVTLLSLLMGVLAVPAQAYLGGFEANDGYADENSPGYKSDVAVYNAGQYGTNPGGTGPGGVFTAQALNSGLWQAVAYGALLDPTLSDGSYVVAHSGGSNSPTAIAFNNEGGAGDMIYRYTLDSRDLGAAPASITDGTVTIAFDYCPIGAAGLTGLYQSTSFLGANGQVAFRIGTQSDGATPTANFYTNTGSWVDSGLDGNTAGWDRVTITFNLSSTVSDTVSLSYTSSVTSATTVVLNSVPVANNIDSLQKLEFFQKAGTSKYYFDNYSMSAVTNNVCTLDANIPSVPPCSTPPAACAITSINVTPGACNNNGTPNNSTDDYYTASVTVNYTNPPATGNLVLSGPALHSSNTVTTVAVGALNSPTSHTFTGVRIVANGTSPTIIARFQ